MYWPHSVLRSRPSLTFPLDREVFWVFCITLLRVLLFIFPVLPRTRLGFFERAGYRELRIFGTNISGGGASVTPNEALPHIGRQPRRNAKDDRCNLPALLE